MPILGTCVVSHDVSYMKHAGCQYLIFGDHLTAGSAGILACMSRKAKTSTIPHLQCTVDRATSQKLRRCRQGCLRSRQGSLSLICGTQIKMTVKTFAVINFHVPILTWDSPGTRSGHHSSKQLNPTRSEVFLTAFYSAQSTAPAARKPQCRLMLNFVKLYLEVGWSSRLPSRIAVARVRRRSFLAREPNSLHAFGYAILSFPTLLDNF